MKLGWQIHDVGGSLPLLDAGFDGGRWRIILIVGIVFDLVCT